MTYHDVKKFNFTWNCSGFPQPPVVRIVVSFIFPSFWFYVFCLVVRVGCKLLIANCQSKYQHCGRSEQSCRGRGGGGEGGQFPPCVLFPLRNIVPILQNFSHFSQLPPTLDIPPPAPSPPASHRLPAPIIPGFLHPVPPLRKEHPI